MRLVIPQPCMGASESALRMSRSSVPCRTSAVRVNSCLSCRSDREVWEVVPVGARWKVACGGPGGSYLLPPLRPSTTSRGGKMTRASTLPFFLFAVCAPPLRGQTIDDGLLMPRRALGTGLLYAHDSWTQYW